MTTKIKEVVFFNAKESIKGFRKNLEELNTTNIEIAVLKGQQLNELTLSDRRVVLNICSLFNKIINKLTEEVNKIDVGMGELDTMINAPSLKYLNTKVKDMLDDMRKNIDKIKEYLTEEDKAILTQKLQEWNDGYKSSWDNYYIRS